MHEHSFTESIIKDIKDQDKVIGISIELGDLVGIEKEHLKEHLGEHTGWDVEINTKKSKVKCDCGYEGEAKIRERLHDLVIFECPECGNLPEVLEGKNIKIVKVVYNE